MAKMPEVLKNMSLFVDGRGYAGRAEEVVLPKLTIKTEEWRGGGMDAPVKLDMGMEALDMEFTLSEFDRDVLKLFGFARGAAVPLSARGALSGNAGEVTPVLVQARGRIVEIDPGTWKAGEKAQTKVSINLSYYKLTIGGEEIVEIDVENMIRRIGGVDQLAGIREALGL